MNSLRSLGFVCALSFFIGSCQAQPAPTHLPYDTPEATHWADSVFSTLTARQKLGQLFMVAAYSNKTPQHEADLQSLSANYGLGGVIFMQGGPVRQARMTQALQEKAKIPLWIAMDAEWDLGMRLDSTFKLPWPMTVGATNDSALSYAYGATIAKHCRRLGVHINFGPVLDLNTNPDNPIINARSFGENRERATRLAHAYFRGLQDNHVLSNAKHFPGHGDTDQDSHKTLPTLSRSKSGLNEIELWPYKKLLPKGMGSVMAAHLNVPALDPGVPTSLSHKVIHTLLREELNYQGLVFTDALNMKGVSESNAPGMLEERALLAGNDVLLFSQDMPLAVEHLEKAIAEGRIKQSIVDAAVRRILRAKYWLLHNVNLIPERGNLVEDLNDSNSAVLHARILQRALTVVSAKNNFNTSMGQWTNALVVAVGTDIPTALKASWSASEVVVVSTPDAAAWNQVLSKAKGVPVVIAHFTSNLTPWKSSSFPASLPEWAQKVGQTSPTMVVQFGNPYALRKAPVEGVEAVLVAYQNHPVAVENFGSFLRGEVSAQGILPVTVGSKAPTGFSHPVAGRGSLVDVSSAEMAGFTGDLESKIAAIAMEGIHSKAYPGCQVVVVRKGQVALNVAYGALDYTENARAVLPSDYYDIASLSKIIGSIPALLALDARGLFSPTESMASVLPEVLRGTPLGSVSALDVLTHQAGLPAWIPFYKKTLLEGKPDPKWYAPQRDAEHPLQVADRLFIRSSIRDSVLLWISQTPLGERKYLYSDLGYYLFQKMIENRTHQSLDVFLQSFVYGPAGITDLRFGPLPKELHSRTAPTEKDILFRGQMIHGTVHDQGAALLGGVSGHAGLFGTARAVAQVMQLYLSMGRFGDQTLFEHADVARYTGCPFCAEGNRRGIGFDKKPTHGDGPTCGCVSLDSYGHTGFTGTYAWADPSTQTVYVFLSNRVHPDAENKSLSQLNIRTRIQQVIQESIVP